MYDRLQHGDQRTHTFILILISNMYISKERKRVLNALYAPYMYKIFSENHTSGIKKWTNEST